MVQRSARGPARLAVLLFSAVVMVSSAAAIRPETSPRRNLLSTCDRLVRPADSTSPAPGELCYEPMTAPFYNTPDIPIIADTQLSGLQYLAPVVHDDPYTPIKPVRRGYNLTAANLFMGAQAGLSLANSYTRSVTYSSTDLGNGDIIHSDICEFVAGNNGVGDAIAINDVKLNQYNAIWLLDPANYMAIKLSTLSPPYAADITGEYYTHSSGTHGAPTQLAVDSKGNAWVGHSTNASEIGSVVKIQGNCDNNGNVLEYQDPCVSNPTLIDPGFDITAMAIDGADNLWILAVKESMMDPSLLNVYMLTSDGVTLTLVYDSVTLGTDATPSSGVAPGGSYAVVDKYGYLYTGSGILKYGGKYNVLRINTVGTPADILVIGVEHQANVLSLDTNSDLWVAGGAGVTKISTSPLGLVPDEAVSTGTFTTATVGVQVITAAAPSTIVDAAAIQSALSVACPAANECCMAGNLDGGIAITRDLMTCSAGPTTDTIYIANTCNLGLVLPITGTTVGAAIIDGVPSAIQSVGVDQNSGVWVTGYSLSGDTLDIITPSSSYIAYVAATVPTVAQPVSATLPAVILVGAGDTTGYFTAQPPPMATYTYLHDTGITGYYKWNLSANGQNGVHLGWVTNDHNKLGFAVGSGIDDTAFTNSAVYDSGTSPQPSVPDGRYFQVSVTLTRFDKTPDLPGPQGYGRSPQFSELSITVPNQSPNAICRSIRAPATADAGGKCVNSFTSEMSSINHGSYDPDFAERDSVSLQYDLDINQPSNLTSDNVDIESFLFVPMSNPANYPVTRLTVQDFLQNVISTCIAKVEIWDENPPVLNTHVMDMTNLANNMDAVSGSSLCTWPPNYEYYCLKDVFNNVGGSFVQTALLPVTDNCAAVTDSGEGGALTVDHRRAMLNDALYPTPVYGTSGFSCVDTDQRSEIGDCTLTSSGTGSTKVFNLCVKAQRRTVYTNTDRVFTMRFNVQDMGTRQGLNDGTIFTRTLRIPPIWKFYPAATCPRAKYLSTVDSTKH